MTKVDLHIYINYDDRLIVNPERIELLKHIATEGSLLKASKNMGISYNKAWHMLDAVNAASAAPIHKKVRGGKGGGGAVLTDYGKLILKEYEAIEHMVKRFNQKLNTEINL